MPNHCNNKLGITGPTKDVEDFIVIVTNESPAPDADKYELFKNLIPMPKALEGTTSPSKENNEELLSQYGADNWYDWCNKNWGTKWGDYNLSAENIEYITEIKYPVLENGDKDYDNGVSVLTDYASIHFEYDTAWAPGCNELADAIINRFPTLNGFIAYEEPGMCFAGHLIFSEGEIVVDEQWEYHNKIDDVSDVDFDQFGE
jgi:hypothetical protein